MKMARTKTGVRFYSSYDINFVKALVDQQISDTIGWSRVKDVEVEIVSFTPIKGNKK